MSWIFLAVAGHLSNTIAFIIDKTLLTTGFKRSASYAALVGLISLILLVAVPWTHLPTAVQWPLVIGFGALNIVALWSFFEALRRAEASRIVPIIGSLIPIITLIGTWTWLGERLATGEWIGLALLTVAIYLLAAGGRTRLDRTTIGFGILTAILFAASSVVGKAAYEQMDFISVFSLSRLASAATAVLLLVIDRQALKEIFSLIHPGKEKRTNTSSIVARTVIAQTAGGVGFILINAALAYGSAVLVNALQAVQYAVLVIVAWTGGKRLQNLLREEVTRPVLIRKTIAILFTAAGLAFISHLL